MKYLAGLLLALLCWKVSPAQSGALPMKSDLLMLRDALEKNHPGLYVYKSKAEMDALFDSCLASVTDSTNVMGTYRLASLMIAGIEDGHTNCRLPKEVVQTYLEKTPIFPGMSFFSHGRAFVFCCRQDSSLAGAELLSINGRPMTAILQDLFRYIPSDGEVESRKNWELMDQFYMLYNLVFGVQDSFRIECRMPDGQMRVRELKAEPLQRVICASPFPRPKKLLGLRYEPAGVAVLKIGSFFNGFLKTTGEDLGSFLDSAFRDIAARHVRRLLIDLRGNQGGDDVNGSLLYAYLAKKPFRYYRVLRNMQGPLPGTRTPNLGVLDPKAERFSGKVFFLVDGRSFSATAEFAAVARSEHRGLFIGEEVGGAYCGNTSGDDLNLRLPQSQISCRIPMIRYEMAVKKDRHPERGVLPGVPVFLTIGDLLAGRDGQLEKTLMVTRR